MKLVALVFLCLISPALVSCGGMLRGVALEPAWTQFRRDPENTARSLRELDLPLILRWETTIDEESGDVGGVVFGSRRVFVVKRTTIGDEIHALRLLDGARFWSYSPNVGGRTRGPPVVHDDRLHVAYSDFPNGSWIDVIDAETGQVIARHEVELDAITEPLVADDERIFLIDQSSGPQGRLVCLSLNSGEELWGLNRDFRGPPTIWGSTVFAVTGLGVLGLSVQDGSTLWFEAHSSTLFPLEAAAPVLSPGGHHVFPMIGIGSVNDVALERFLYNGTDLFPLWTFEEGENSFSSPSVAIDWDRVLLKTARGVSSVATAEQVWHLEDPFPYTAEPALSPGMYFYLTRDRLRALDTENGQILWEEPLPDDASNFFRGLLAIDQGVLVVAHGNTIRAYIEE